MNEQEKERQRLKKDLEVVMSTPSGRRIIWRLLGIAGTFTRSFDTDSQYATAFNEGKRSVGLDIYDDIMQYCPERYIQAQNEHNSAIADKARKIQEQEEKNNGGK